MTRDAELVLIALDFYSRVRGGEGANECRELAARIRRVHSKTDLPTQEEVSLPSKPLKSPSVPRETHSSYNHTNFSQNWGF